MIYVICLHSDVMKLKMFARTVSRSLKFTYRRSQMLLQSDSVRCFSGASNDSADKRLSIVGLGNPLLDLTMFECQQLLEKYDLIEDSQMLARPEHKALFQELTTPPNTPLMVPGGATQNSIRVAQWILGDEGSTGFIGAIGDDDEGRLLEKVARDSGIAVAYQVRPGERTGICAALITGENRTLVTELGAAVHLDADVTTEPRMSALLRAADLLYIGGYLWSCSPANVVRAAEFAASHSRLLAMNLHARFLCSFFASAEYNVLPLVDILFGNEREALTLAHCLADSNFPFAERFVPFRLARKPSLDVLMAIAERLAEIPRRDGSRAGRMIVFTAGREPVVLLDGREAQAEARAIPVEGVPPDEVRDTNGCGDAFAGAFLAQVTRGEDLETAVRCGMFASSVVVRNFGCTFPKEMRFEA